MTSDEAIYRLINHAGSLERTGSICFPNGVVDDECKQLAAAIRQVLAERDAANARAEQAERQLEQVHAKLDEYEAARNQKCVGFPVMTLAERIYDLQARSWALGQQQGQCESAAELEQAQADAALSMTLLCEVYAQAGNGAPAKRRHALTPGLRDRIRDAIHATNAGQPLLDELARLKEICQRWVEYQQAILAKEFDKESLVLKELFEATQAAAKAS